MGQVYRVVCLFTSQRWNRYQIILLGDRGTCVWTTCLRPWVTSGLQVRHVTVRLPSHTNSNTGNKKSTWRLAEPVGLWCEWIRADLRSVWGRVAAARSATRRQGPPSERRRSLRSSRWKRWAPCSEGRRTCAWTAPSPSSDPRLCTPHTVTH